MRKLMWFAVGFCLATIACVYNWIESFLTVALIFAVCATLLLIGCYWKRFLRIPGVILLAAIVGIGWFCAYDAFYLSDARSLDAQKVTADVVVTDYSYQNDYGWVAPGVATYKGNDYRVLMYLKKEADLKPGDKVSGEFSLRFTSDGGAREPTYHRSQGVFLLAYQKGDVTYTNSDEIPLRYYPTVWKHSIAKRVDSLFTAETAAFIKALLVGERVDIDYETNTAFKVSGISHIIAVSGLHMSVLFGAVYALTMRKRWLSGIIGIPVLVLFAAVVGFTPSITRACIMQCIMLIGLMLKREYDPATALAASVCVMIFSNPMVVLSISFQLSVGCMIGIFLFSERIQAWFASRECYKKAGNKGVRARILRWFASSVSVSISASVITAPLVAYYFQTISLVSVLTNLLTVWLVSYIFMFSAIALILSLFSAFPVQILVVGITAAVQFIVGTAKLLSGIPLAAVYTYSNYIVIWFVGVYLMLAVFLLLKKKPVILYCSCVTVTLCLALVAGWLEPRMDECRVTVLNIGQGQSILLQSEGKTFLVDCGGDSDTASADIAAQTLLSQGVFSLDGVIVTHYDRDHTGGLEYLLSRVDTDAVFLPNLEDSSGLTDRIAQRRDLQKFYIREDTVLTFGNVKITLFAPEIRSHGNEFSLCVLFQTENCDILITGDRGILGEAFLLNRYDFPQLEVLIAGHHGSKYSTGDRLLAETRPEIVLISAGENNTYGHPAPELLERVSKYGCRIYRTDQSGTIIYRW